jgi:hypothetical protein
MKMLKPTNHICLADAARTHSCRLIAAVPTGPFLKGDPRYIQISDIPRPNCRFQIFDTKVYGIAWYIIPFKKGKAAAWPQHQLRLKAHKGLDRSTGAWSAAHRRDQAARGRCSLRWRLLILTTDLWHTASSQGLKNRQVGIDLYSY